MLSLKLKCIMIYIAVLLRCSNILFPMSSKVDNMRQRGGILNMVGHDVRVAGEKVSQLRGIRVLLLPLMFLACYRIQRDSLKYRQAKSQRMNTEQCVTRTDTHQSSNWKYSRSETTAEANTSLRF